MKNIRELEWIELRKIKKNPALLERDSMTEFKNVIVKRFKRMKSEMSLLLDGNISNADLTDAVGSEVVVTVTTLINCGVVLLNVFGLVSSIVTAGIAIPLTLLGLAGVVGLNYYRGLKKQAMYENATNFFDDDNADEYFQKIAESLAVLYRYQLSVCSREEARKFANACFTALAKEVMTNKKISLVDLVHPDLLQSVIQRSVNNIPKLPIQINSTSSKIYDARMLAKHPAIYSPIRKITTNDLPNVSNNRFAFFNSQNQHLGWGWRLLYKIKSTLFSFFKPRKTNVVNLDINMENKNKL